MNTLRIAIVVLVFIGSGFILCPRNPDAGQVNPEVLLMRVLHAEHTVPYTADQIYEAAYLGKTHRENVHRVMPGDGDASALRSYYDLIQSNYVPLVEGEDRVAGREVWTLRLMPDRDKYPWRKHAPWKQLWVDKETYVVLASREWTSTNRIKRSMRSKSVKYKQPLNSPGFPEGPASADDHSVTTAINAFRADARYNEKMETFIPRYIPGGYALVEARFVGMSTCRFTYSDGLYCINITGDINTSVSQNLIPDIRDCGQCLVYSRTTSGRSVTITADLPKEELLKLINSVD